MRNKNQNNLLHRTPTPAKA